MKPDSRSELICPMKIQPVSEASKSKEENGTVPTKCALTPESHPFWSKVQKGEPDECWPWKLGKDKDGYGRTKLLGRKIGAHRAALLLTHGTAVVDLEVRHECDNPPCCNPNHLVPGTHAQNMADRNARGRQAKGERNGRAKLTADTVLAIRAAYVPHKVSVRTLAARFGVNHYIVSDIVRRVTWKGIEPVKEAA